MFAERSQKRNTKQCITVSTSHRWWTLGPSHLVCYTCRTLGYNAVYSCFNKSQVVNLGALSLSVLYMHCTEREEMRKKYNAMCITVSTSHRWWTLGPFHLVCYTSRGLEKIHDSMHNCFKSQVMNLGALSLSVLCMYRVSRLARYSRSLSVWYLNKRSICLYIRWWDFL